VEFIQSRDPDAAANDHRDRVALVRGPTAQRDGRPGGAKNGSRASGHHLAGIFERPQFADGNHDNADAWWPDI